MSDPRSFGFALKGITRLYTRRFEDRARSVGLTLSQCKVLVYLARHEGVSQTRLSDLVEIEPMNLVRILDHMEVAGWLERRPDPTDRRARQLFLKPKSTTVVEDIWRISDVVRAEGFAGIAAPDAALLVALLEKVHANMLALAPLSDTPTQPAGRVRPQRLRAVQKS